MDLSHNLGELFNISYLIFAFFSALLLGTLKGLLVGPIACLVLILGNIGVILALLPSHIVWTIYTLVQIKFFDAPLKVAILLVLPLLFAIWLGLSISVSVIVGIGYGFSTPWVSTFEAFRHENQTENFLHSVVDGTWGTIRGSCTVVRDFGDFCYHSYPLYLKELRESPSSNELQPLRLIHVPGCIVVGVMGVMVEIPVYTAIAVVKSPYMLFKGWFRLTHDLVSREGPFLETACIPVAGLMILLWPIVVVGCVFVAVFSGLIVGLYAPVVVYQERSFRRGLAYVVAMVGEFDEYTNDWLYLREGTVFPKPQYRRKRTARTPESSVRGRVGSASPAEAPAMLVPSLARSISVKEAIQEVKMVQIWAYMMRSCEMNGKHLLDAEILSPADLHRDSSVVGVGLPCFSLLQTLMKSIRANSPGILLGEDLEVTDLNRPKDKILDWFFNPVVLLKEQIQAIELGEEELRFLEKTVLFGGDRRRVGLCENCDALRAAQIQGISRRMMGVVRSVSKFPTYRRRFRQVVKDLVAYCSENEGSISRGSSTRSVLSVESV